MMESAGVRLKKIRLEKGLSLEEVQKNTRIHLSVLKAIEEDSAVNLSPIYIKGFLKIYCKFLGVEPAEYISGYKEPQQAQVLRSAKEKQGIIKDKPPSFFKTASVRLRTFRPNKKIKQFFITAAAVAVISVALFQLGKFISSRKHTQKGVKRPEPVADTAKVKKSQATAPQKASGQAAKQKSKNAETAAPKEVSSVIRLGILAREDCWVTLKADGRIVFHSTMKKGKSESWQAKDKMELSLGNAAGVDLIINGERISPLGKKGQARKNILITKEGLSAQ